jgi:heterodisulfide reductase subunit A
VGAEGNFTVTVLQQPRFVDMEKCIACGLCAEKCPKKVGDDYNEGLIKRKAIYVPYSQAVPLKYTIDAENCIFLKKGRFDYYSYAGLPDVVTSLEFERILSATGPYSGHLVRPSSMRRQASSDGKRSQRHSAGLRGFLY